MVPDSRIREPLIFVLSLVLVLGLAPVSVLAADASARANLKPVPYPDIDKLKPGIRAILEPAMDRFQKLSTSPGVSDKQLAQAYGQLGLHFQAFGERKAADVAYANAEGLMPENFRWPYYRAVMQETEGHDEMARKFYGRAIELSPNYQPAHVRLGRLELKSGHYDQAAAQFVTALRQQASDAPALEGQAELAMHDGNPGRAIKLLKKALDIQPKADALHAHLAEAYRKAGNSDDAQAEAGKAGKREPVIRDPLLALVDAYTRSSEDWAKTALGEMAQGRDDSALRFFQLAITVNPANADAYVGMARLLASQGHMKEAHQYIGAAFRLAPDNPQAHLVAGYLLNADGKPAAALKEFRTAHSNAPDDPEIKGALANALMTSQQYADAAPLYLSLGQKRDPQSTKGDYLFYAGLAFLGADNCGKALDPLMQAVRLQPNDLATALTLARGVSSCPAASDAQRSQALAFTRNIYQRVQNVDSGASFAMALAANGKYDQAVKIQQRTLAASDAGHKAWEKQFLEANLRRYREHKPAQHAFAANDPIFKPSAPVGRPATAAKGAGG
ncbi:MAG: tetratricopeptide repeat protein [Gammaproteobacteria bacterium]|jgi:tetratricopeptide (TPR) repeat protein